MTPRLSLLRILFVVITIYVGYGFAIDTDHGHGPHSPWPTTHSHWCSTPTTTLSPTATIDAGVLIGTTTNLPSATAAVNKFLGVPFAQSPPERFAAPQSPGRFSKPIVAQAWKDACIQQFVYPLPAQQFAEAVFNQPPPNESEDCLYLNVYAPSSPPPPGGRAVMFWIYGGSLQFGHAGQPTYDGSAFAAYQDVIVVAPNYRTNVFGFANAPELPKNKRNPGFLDQRAALQWVQDNIHVFGGNPAKVTIFGESAGATSVDALLTTYSTQDAPFRAAILESGQYSYRAVPRPSGVLAWNALTSYLNCTSPTNNLTCVRAASAATIKTIIEQHSLAFNPYPDNVTYALHPALRRQQGHFAKVPVMGGTNAQEGRVFEYGQSNLTAFLQTSFGSTVPQIIPTIEAAFPIGTTVGVNTPYDVISAIDTLFAFQCSQALWANETAAQGVPTWRYFYNASFPNWSPLNGLLGVYHSSEIPLAFGTYPGGPVNPTTPAPVGLIPSNLPPTAQEEALSSFMNTAWAAFAKDPMRGPGWNKLGTFDGQDVGVLGPFGSSGVTVVTENSLDELCPIFFPAFKAVAGDVYGL